MINSFRVLGGYSRSWQEVIDGAHLDEDQRTTQEQEEILAALREELSLIASSESLVVLAGSGASLGITGAERAPTMRSLWMDVKALPSFDSVENRLSPGPVKDGNLENILSDAQARLSLSPDDAELRRFIAEAEDIVWNKCSFVTENSGLESHELFLRKVARRSTRLQRTQVFTTNYDLAFETAARRARFNIIDGFGYGGQGFDGASFDLDYVRRRPHEPLVLEPSVFHLLKLHGSVDWEATEDGVKKWRGNTKPNNPVLIYPSASKYQLSYQQPYLEFMSRFQIALRQPDVGVIVVGFGFNDDHLAAPIEAAIRSNSGLRAVFVSPDIRAERRADTLNWTEQLILKGDRRLTLLEARFDDLVRVLPDVPAREEWDAHSERVRLGGPRS
ncbi:SIR2 family protein [Rothia kristinae]|uniref:SIR2 family protein n=1 Tax=Rothia kristinae TaxID=37923 RepID=A0A7T3CFS2_9MICC|nr:SIR2 family protein [Rothia kristinae]QPT53341.1 SIR2 family protein [Rothia kristinae]SQC28870.1 Uncharacterised protein [Rothia kristinae]